MEYVDMILTLYAAVHYCSYMDGHGIVTLGNMTSDGWGNPLIMKLLYV